MAEEINLFSVGQVSAKLGVSEQMVYKLIREEKLSASAVGRHYRISSVDIDNYLEAGKQKARERAARARGGAKPAE